MNLTRDDLAVLSADIKAYIRERAEDADARNVERFNGVNRRLDTVNGNIARHEQLIAERTASHARLDEKTANLAREVFRRRTEAAGQRVSTEDDKPAITKGGVRRFLSILAGGGVIVEALHRIGPLVWAVLAHGGGR